MASSLRRRIQLSCALSLALASCAHADDLRAPAVELPPRPAPPLTAAADAAEPQLSDAGANAVTAVHDASDVVAPLLLGRSERPDQRCAIPLADPELVVARVGRVRITACDLALERQRRTQAGLRADDPRALARAVVRDVLLSTRAPMPLPGDREIAEALSGALVRAEASANMAPVDLSDERLAEYAEGHRALFVRDPRVHARGLALPSREAAIEAIAAIRGGAPLSSMAATATRVELRRDLGDLGLLWSGGSSQIPDAVVAAALALTRDGEVHPEPIPVELGSGRRGRRRGGASRVEWWVVERVDRSGEEPMSDVTIRRRIAQRLIRDRYRDAVRAVEQRLRESVLERARAAVIPRALDAVRVTPAP